MNTSGRHLIETQYDAWTTCDLVAAPACVAADIDFKGGVDAFFARLTPCR